MLSDWSGTEISMQRKKNTSSHHAQRMHACSTIIVSFGTTLRNKSPKNRSSVDPQKLQVFISACKTWKNIVFKNTYAHPHPLLIWKTQSLNKIQNNWTLNNGLSYMNIIIDFFKGKSINPLDLMNKNPSHACINIQKENIVLELQAHL